MRVDHTSDTMCLEFLKIWVYLKTPIVDVFAVDVYVAGRVIVFQRPVGVATLQQG